MRQYIVDLTNYLISKNRYDEILHRIVDWDKFVQHVKLDLESGDVRTMNPNTLGRIMCSFEIGDVMASKKDLFNGVSFSGDCEEMLRELISLCLAYAIRDRLDDRCPMGVPRWEGRIPGFQSSFKRAIGETVGQTIGRIATKHLDRKSFSMEEVCREVCQELNSGEPNQEHSVSPDDIRDNVAHAVLEIEKKRGKIPS